MGYIYNFKDFLNEVKIRDYYTNNVFSEDEPLMVEMVSNYRDIKIQISYYDTEDHSILERIKTKTNLISISEFNTILRGTINQIFPDKISEFYRDGKYELYLIDNKFSIIISYEEHKVFKETPELTVVTIMAGVVNNCIKRINIFDENFLF